MVAEAIRLCSLRREKQLVEINCGSFPETLLESELFGHVKGAFTGAIADKKGLFEIAEEGTLLLDEIADLSLFTQAKLMRVLETKKIMRVGATDGINVNLRIISTSNADIEALIEEGKFREDLYYRLNVIKISLPSLRQRKEDIPLLVDHFVDKYGPAGNVIRIDPKAFEFLIHYDCPGNVRELENIIERAVVLSEHKIITVRDLPSSITHLSSEFGTECLDSSENIHLLPRTIEIIEKAMIEKALTVCNGNFSSVAKYLGISRPALYRKKKKYSITCGESK